MMDSDVSASSKEGNMSGGRGQYCCIPECGSARYDRHKNKTGIGLFTFPSKEKDSTLYRKWVKVISQHRRKGCGDMFDPGNKNNVICEKHFKPDEVRCTFGSSRRKMLVKDAVPSTFSFKDSSVKRRPSPKKRWALTQCQDKHAQPDDAANASLEEELIVAEDEETITLNTSENLEGNTETQDYRMKLLIEELNDC